MRSPSRNALVQECLPLVRRVALHMASRLPSQVDLSDLTQAGVLGLLDAASKYDADRGVRFRTYAELRIRGSILDSLRGLDWLPRSVRRRRREIDSARRQLEARLGRSPKDDEVAEELDLTTDELRKMVDDVRRAETSSERVEGLEGIDTLVPDPNAIDPHELLERNELLSLLVRGIEELSHRERLVVTLYYHEELTMKEVGEVLGVNESRVSQIHSKACQTLRLRLRKHLRPQRARAVARVARES